MGGWAVMPCGSQVPSGIRAPALRARAQVVRSPVTGHTRGARVSQKARARPKDQTALVRQGTVGRVDVHQVSRYAGGRSAVAPIPPEGFGQRRQKRRRCAQWRVHRGFRHLEFPCFGPHACFSRDSRKGKKKANKNSLRWQLCSPLHAQAVRRPADPPLCRFWLLCGLDMPSWPCRDNPKGVTRALTASPRSTAHMRRSFGHRH